MPSLRAIFKISYGLILGLAGTLLLMLPGRLQPCGAWSYPLESWLAWIWLLAWWTGCIFVVILSHSVRTVWGVLIVLGIAKAGLILAGPEQGLWAQFEINNLTSWTGRELPLTQEVLSLLRPNKENWWFHRSAKIPPWFINDHRRFNYYPDHQFQRECLPYRFRLKGWLLFPAKKATIVSPAGGVLCVGKQMAKADSLRQTQITVRGPGVLKVTLDVKDSTETPVQHRLVWEVNGNLKPIESWRWLSQGETKYSAIYLAILFWAGRVWNILLCGLLLIVWAEPLRRFFYLVRKRAKGGYETASTLLRGRYYREIGFIDWTRPSLGSR